MRSVAVRLLVVLTALATALLVASCTDAKTDEPAQSLPDQPAISGQPAGYDADDVAFATNMIAHHQQAVEMTALVPDRSADPDVVQLAADIAAAQGPDIEIMKVFLVQWNENPDTGTDTDTGTGGGGHGNTMQGMVDDATMARLESLTGPDFDTLWLQSMIGHHQGAIDVAKAEIAAGNNVDAVDLAKRMVDAQQAQINRMRQSLAGGE